MFRCLIWFLFLVSLSVTRLDANMASSTVYGIREEGALSCTLGASYVYWYPSQDGLDIYRNVDPMGAVDTEDSDPVSTVFYPNIEARSGFQIFGSYLLYEDEWDLSFQYSWFSNKDNPYTRQKTPADDATDNNNFFASWDLESVVSGTDQPRPNGFVADAVSSAWNNAFNRVDLVFGKVMYGGSNFDLRPFFGLAAAWEEQTLLVSYGWIRTTSSSNANDDVMTPTVTEWDVSQCWWGVGPIVGVQPGYHLWKSESMESCLSLCTKGSVELFWANLDVLMFQLDNVDDADTVTTVARYKDVTNEVTPGLSVCLGLCWESLFDEVAVKLAFGWEQQVLLDYGYVYPFLEHSSAAGMYSMQGFTVSGSIGF